MFEIAFTSCIFVGWIVSVCAHEFGHALIAYWGGDTSVKDKGYLTFNPLKYTDLQLSLVLPLIFLLLGGIPLPGGAVYINQHQLRNRWWQSAVSLAGPVATLLFAGGLSLILRQIPGGTAVLAPASLERLFSAGDSSSFQAILQENWLAYSLYLLIILEIAALVLNLLPIPPLDGYGVFQPWLPQAWQQQLRGFSRYGFLLVFAAFWLVPAVGRFFWAFVFLFTASLFQFPLEPLFSTFIVTYHIFQAGSRPLLVALIVVAVIVTQVQKRRQADRSGQPRSGRSTPTPRRPRIPPQPPQVHLATVDAALAALTDPDEAASTDPSQSLTDPDVAPGSISGGNGADRLDSSPASDTTPGQSDRAALLLRRAMILLRLGQSAAALAALQQSLQANPNQAKVWYELGQLQRQQQQQIAALEAFQEAIELDPAFGGVWYEMGLTQLELGQLEPALQSFKALEAVLPRLALAPYLQGVTLGHLQRWKAALVAFDRALSLNPHWADLWFDRGFVLMQLGQYEGALLSLDRGLDRDPDRLLAYYNKACCYSQRGEADRALEFLHIVLAGDGPQGSGTDSLRARALTDPLLEPLRSHPQFPH
ncbi:MAG: tetratricopeptide repeat protein [Prochlorothrix sp.]